MRVDPDRLLFMFGERILIFLKSDSFYLPSVKTLKMAANPLKRTEIRRYTTEVPAFRPFCQRYGWTLWNRKEGRATILESDILSWPDIYKTQPIIIKIPQIKDMKAMELKAFDRSSSDAQKDTRLIATATPNTQRIEPVTYGLHPMTFLLKYRDITHFLTNNALLWQQLVNITITTQ